MINVSNDFRTRCENGTFQFIRITYPEVVPASDTEGVVTGGFYVEDNILYIVNGSITSDIVEILGGTDKILSSVDVMQGGMSIDRYCVSSDKLELGSAIASEMTLVLNNLDGHFSGIELSGKELHVEIGVKVGDTIEYMPVGVFIVDNLPRMLSTITVSTLDRMVLFDKTVDGVVLPKTAAEMVSYACEQCGVPFSQDISTLPNASYSITTVSTEMTWRNVIQNCASIMGTCAYMDENGELRFKWYTDTTVEVNGTTRFEGDIQDADVSTTGIKCGDVLVGTNDYAFDLSDNSMLTHDISAALSNLNIHETYRPWNATTISMPYVMPLDKIVYVDPTGTEHITLVTNVNHTVNGHSVMSGVGESLQSNGYARGSAFTPTQKSEMADEVGSIVESKIEVEKDRIVAEVKEEIGGDIVYKSELTVLKNEISAEVESNVDAKGYFKLSDNQALLSISQGDIASVIEATTNTINLSSGQLTIDTANFTLDSDGNVSMTGDVVANAFSLDNTTEKIESRWKVDDGRLEYDDITIDFNGESVVTVPQLMQDLSTVSINSFRYYLDDDGNKLIRPGSDMIVAMNIPWLESQNVISNYIHTTDIQASDKVTAYHIEAYDLKVVDIDTYTGIDFYKGSVSGYLDISNAGVLQYNGTNVSLEGHTHSGYAPTIHNHMGKGNQIPNGTDLNTLDIGTYYSATNATDANITNCPYTSYGFHLEVMNSTTDSNYIQILYPNSNGYFYMRRGSSKTNWGNWYKYVGEDTTNSNSAVVTKADLDTMFGGLSDLLGGGF